MYYPLKYWKVGRKVMYNANMKKVDTEFKTLQNFIVNYEVASQRKSRKEKFHRDLLTQAVKTYGH